MLVTFVIGITWTGGPVYNIVLLPLKKTYQIREITVSQLIRVHRDELWSGIRYPDEDGLI